MKIAVVQLSPGAPRVRIFARTRPVKAGPSWAPSTARTPKRPGRAQLLALLCFGFLACRSGDVNPPAPSAAGHSPAVPQPGARGAKDKANDGYRPLASEPWHIPVGPKLAIAPGKGFGPIRFGARLDTIERLMGEPCEEKREEGAKVTCRYSAHAVDFVLENGGVTQMRAHRLGRPFKNTDKPDYGIFNGSFENGLAFGMLPSAARELVGAPKSVRAVTGDNPFHTVEVHEYDGFLLEFDRVKPDRLMLGGVVLDAPRS